MLSSDTTTFAEPQAQPLHDRAEAEAYVASVCFKTGPPALVGVELEWTVHHADHPRRPLTTDTLRNALGTHAPPLLAPESPHHPLPNGSLITVEPGGQVEISTQPAPSLAGLLPVATADIAYLVELLRSAGLRLGKHGIDAHRLPNRLLQVPRYAAMESAFNRRGPDGRTMMCSTAGLQVCVDAGEPGRVATRWATAHALGPLMLAAFANSAEFAGRRTGWASARMRALFGTDPNRTRAGEVSEDPGGDWARRVMDTPVICLRRPGTCWDAPPGLTFGAWADGALDRRPTTDDLDYHLTTMFPPVRPRGYLEIRYLDTQPTGEWVVPVALLLALFHRESTVDSALDAVSAAADRWHEAARHGLTDPVLAMVAPQVFDLALRALPELGLPAATAALVEETVGYLLAGRAPVGAAEELA
ncbi:ergothioneine biosynthesis glutamate--cysteine ligase EgtA [Crossiella sp. SN42]|uniref:ergothioneine biosynthesis glutamate--cysteine ligase EgtA n=1 Tax=Crossiella sp. SN42 TaxID=2944808 RepID=UPI00207D496E|nr:ergothioneine biosynthesis glutamate--cysteine ligase EgtA [Crossiella sp. SN42]MCO1577464.1 ergothioneine biosynthesis glutamate--cysteine ligase EgtA [Crossiella sp. SN42]